MHSRTAALSLCIALTCAMQFPSVLAAQGKPPAISISDMKNRCTSYGTTPGTTEFYRCMNALDDGNIQPGSSIAFARFCELSRTRFKQECIQAVNASPLPSSTKPENDICAEMKVRLCMEQAK
jgi:hypothetical protein